MGEWVGDWGCVIGGVGVGPGVGGGDGCGDTSQKWPQKGGANIGANEWVCLRCGSSPLTTHKYRVCGASGCAHLAVAPRGAHSVGPGWQHKMKHPEMAWKRKCKHGY